jgi:hypothetical protein
VKGVADGEVFLDEKLEPLEVLGEAVVVGSSDIMVSSAVVEYVWMGIKLDILATGGSERERLWLLKVRPSLMLDSGPSDFRSFWTLAPLPRLK